MLRNESRLSLSQINPSPCNIIDTMEIHVENSTPTPRLVGRPFRKGVSGNPGGRPKGLGAYVRDNTLEGEELADFYLAIFRGEKIDGKKPGLRRRMEAGTWLSDRWNRDYGPYVSELL